METEKLQPDPGKELDKNQIKELKSKILEINKAEQKSEGFKVKDKRIKGDTYPDRNKEVVKLEEEIRQLERKRIIEKSRAEGRQSFIESQKFDNEIIPEESELNEKSEEVTSTEREDDKSSELKLAVEEARKKYATKDFEVNNSIGNIKKTLGQWMKITPENVTDTQTFYNQYKIALNELKDYQLEQIRGKNLSPEETKKQLEETIKYFSFNEKLNLYQARVEARDSVKKDRLSEKVIQNISKSINWYRKLPAKYKIALSAGLFLGGAGAGMAGAAGVASFFGAARVAQRIAGGAAAGVGVAGLQEGFRRKWDEKKSQEEAEKIIKDFEAGPESLEEKFERVKSKLEEEIGTYQKDLQREKRKIFSRKVWGASAGIFIGSGAMAYAMKELGVGDYLSKTGKSARGFLGTTNLMPEGGSTGAHEEAVKKVPSAKVLEPEKPKIKSPLEGKRTGVPGKSPEYEGEKENYPRRGRSRILEREKISGLEDKSVETEKDLPDPDSKKPIKIIPRENPGGRAPTLEIKKPLVQSINFAGAEDLGHSEISGTEIPKRVDSSELFSGQAAGKYEFSWSDSLDDRAMKTMKFISMENRTNWNQMKGMNFDEIKSGMSKDVYARAENLRKIFEGELGSEANPRKKETIFNWIRRVVGLAEDKAKNYRSI